MQARLLITRVTETWLYFINDVIHNEHCNPLQLLNKTM